MKKFVFLSFLLAVSNGVGAWTVGPQRTAKAVATKPDKTQNGWVAAAAAATLTLATIATPIAPATAIDQPLSADQHPTMMVAAGAYIPEDSYTSTDLSLPKYNVENDKDLMKNEPNQPKAPNKPAPKKVATTKDKNRAPNAGTADESPAARERRLKKEAEEEVRAAEIAAKEAARKEVELARKKSDLEKAAAAKAAKAELQAKRLAQRGKIAAPVE